MICVSDEGIVESIDFRSTRIPGSDRTLTAIPNGPLSKMSIVNLAHQMLIQSVLGVRCEPRPEQLRYLIINVREMLLGHPSIHPDSSPAQMAQIGQGRPKPGP